MFRIIRTETLRTLRRATDERDAARAELAAARHDAELAKDSAIRAETTGENLLRDLAQAHADRIKAERAATAARVALDGRDRTEAETMQQIRADLNQIRADAADPELGKTMKAAIAHGVLRRLYADAIESGIVPGRPWDILALVLDLGADDAPAGYPAPAIVAADGQDGGRQ
jgi:hypothetical protein